MPLLKISGLNYNNDKKSILKNINLEAQEDGITCVLGPSGCGKTTLLKLISGLEKTQDGEIILKNETISSKTLHKETEKRNIGFLFQEFALFPHLTVEENLKFALNNKAQNREIIDDILKIVKLSDSINKYPHELSGGEQQRTALARSIIAQPDLLLLDEPFSSLDLNLREEIRDDTLHLLQRFNISAIVVTHDPFEAMFMSNKIYIMDKNGSIVQSGAPAELYNKPVNSYVAEFFGETNKFEGTVINSTVITPIGNIPVSNMRESDSVNVYVRPQAIELTEEKTPVNGIKGTVVTSKLIGSFSLVHLSVLGDNNEVIHVHSQMPSNFLPKQSTAVGIKIDNSQIFIFSK
ncbi:MAG: Fe(3+) ions import ATP-binding protein FbpC [Alphaproteobacteria bacterium MarineAlpha5_Bin11]|nr:ABC transporter ATP-binding protein [Pelagibacteraceae bacterium]PPR44044.1 MAG: Fe(3+) ions import ATP-binding protein FbpC [Alphaproteobacteria bacterium MarineAlpha5_Bin11]PPR51991.1 MAG: Fe(3+) ions import ATP-binding protein FbpC [Alphaproteobacteria bacterium MarineAlpha5_Bin10]|tara:strand:- start:5697 stop:6746 length:1050 start_codon:yes stop_codon:yes gene_type:complete